jgi:hypothetical protein
MFFTFQLTSNSARLLNDVPFTGLTLRISQAKSSALVPPPPSENTSVAVGGLVGLESRKMTVDVKVGDGVKVS